jgi:hypothetical protein
MGANGAAAAGSQAHFPSDEVEHDGNAYGADAVAAACILLARIV